MSAVPGAEARAGRFPGPSLMPHLHAIQAEHGWLPREELVTLAREQRRPLYEIEGLISFYPHFLTEPPPKVELACCHDLSCWLQGGEERVAELRERYRDDPDVHLREVSCIGRCDAAPAVAVNEFPAGAAQASVLVEAARSNGSTRAGLEADRGGARPRANDPYEPDARDYRVLRAALAGSLDAARILDELKESGLRGMGGAGFPTGTKWELVAKQEAEPKYAICNADESEPGTFKDRQIMAEQPHLVLEGLLLGMLVTGAREGWVFVRHEYAPEEAVVREEIERLRSLGLLEGLTLDVFVSPGGYILGEESALIECMEGHRGEPRNKPPFPGVYGLWGKPTLMNSVETLAHVPVILERGARWWAEQGANGSKGLKFFAVSGHVERPGVYCVPMGTPARDLLDQAGGMAGGVPARCHPARGRLLELPRSRRARRPARLRLGGRGGLHARLGGARGDRRGHRPAGGGHQRAPLLSRRVVRQVRALPARVDQGARDPHGAARRGGRRGGRGRPDHRAREDDAPDLHLRARPGGSGSGGERARAAPRRDRGASSSALGAGA